MADKFDQAELLASFAAVGKVDHGWPFDRPLGSDPQLNAALLMYAVDRAGAHGIVVDAERLLPASWQRETAFPTLLVRREHADRRNALWVGIDSSAFKSWDQNINLRSVRVNDSDRERFDWTYKAFPGSYTPSVYALFDTVEYIWMGVSVLLSRMG